MDILELTALFVLPALLVLVWPRFDFTILAPVALSVAVALGVSVVTTERVIEEATRSIADREARGEPLAEWEEMYDGVGDRVAALFLGTTIPLTVAGFTIYSRAVWRRWRKQPEPILGQADTIDT